MQPGKTVQTIGILSRPRREQLSAVVPPLLKWLEARGIKPVLDEDTAAALAGRFPGQPAPAGTHSRMRARSKGQRPSE